VYAGGITSSGDGDGLTLMVVLGVRKPPSDGVITGIELPRSLKSNNKSRFDFGFDTSDFANNCFSFCDFSLIFCASSSLSLSLDSSLELELDNLLSDFLKYDGILEQFSMTTYLTTHSSLEDSSSY
jgi:hypothetical protein